MNTSRSSSSSTSSSNGDAMTTVTSPESSPKTPKLSNSNNNNNTNGGIYYKIQPCSKCWKKAEEYQESTCYCQDCDLFLCKFHTKTHLKKSHHHHISSLPSPRSASSATALSLLNVNNTNSPPQTSRTGSGGKPPKCVLHSVSINTFCRTCQLLICAACSVESHKGHDAYLIENIEEEERAKLFKELNNLDMNVQEWDNSHGFGSSSPQFNSALYVNKLSEMKLRMKQQSNDFFNQVQQVVKEKQQLLNASIDELCQAHERIFDEISQMKRELKLLSAEFSNLNEMSGYELLEKKQRKYYKTISDFEKLKVNFKFSDVSDMVECQLIDMNEIVEDIRMELNSFSNVSNIMKRRVIPKSLSFVNSLEQQENEKNNMSNPYDVKISHNYNVLLVSDYFNSRILVFDLKTKKFKGSIKTFFRPHCLLIDEDISDSANIPKSGFTSRTMLFIGSNDRSVYKFNLSQVLKISIIDNMSQFYEWRQSSGLIAYPSGMALCKQFKILFVCDYNNNCIHLLNPQTGQLIHKLDQSTCGLTFVSPWGIDISHNGHVIVSETASNRIQIFKLLVVPESPLATGTNSKNSYQVELKHSLGKSGSANGEFNFVRGLVYDKSCRQLLVCDSSNKRIELFDERGEYLHSFKCEQLQGPYGMCFNEVNGELYVADYSRKKVHVLKVT